MSGPLRPGGQAGKEKNRTREEALARRFLPCLILCPPSGYRGRPSSRTARGRLNSLGRRVPYRPAYTACHKWEA